MIELITTGDGSHSLVHTGLGETYHSTHGAIRESLYVFIQQGIDAAQKKDKIRILEIGFGTGLNALLSWLHAEKSGIPIEYESWELFPLESRIVSQLNYGTELHAPAEFRKLHDSPWDALVILSQRFTFSRWQGDIVQESWRPHGTFDIIFYDAFAPSRQPEMWSRQVLERSITSLNPGGILVTYCAKGQVKRDLRGLGLSVESLQGPPGKREMIRATKPL